jgi:hypothetical protein
MNASKFLEALLIISELQAKLDSLKVDVKQQLEKQKDKENVQPQ